MARRKSRSPSPEKRAGGSAWLRVVGAVTHSDGRLLNRLSEEFGRRCAGRIYQWVLDAREAASARQFISSLQPQLQALQRGRVVTKQSRGRAVPSIVGQGDPSMHTSDALLARFDIRKDLEVVAEIERIWDNMPKQNGEITWPMYEWFATKLFNAIVPPDNGAVIGEANRARIIASDWERDTRGAKVLNCVTFCSCVFHMADTWCETLEKKEYLFFLRRCYHILFDSDLYKGKKKPRPASAGGSRPSTQEVGDGQGRRHSGQQLGPRVSAHVSMAASLRLYRNSFERTEWTGDYELGSPGSFAATSAGSLGPSDPIAGKPKGVLIGPHGPAVDGRPPNKKGAFTVQSTCSLDGVDFLEASNDATTRIPRIEREHSAPPEPPQCDEDTGTRPTEEVEPADSGAGERPSGQEKEGGVSTPKAELECHLGDLGSEDDSGSEASDHPAPLRIPTGPLDAFVPPGPKVRRVCELKPQWAATSKDLKPVPQIVTVSASGRSTLLESGSVISLDERRTFMPSLGLYDRSTRPLSILSHSVVEGDFDASVVEPPQNTPDPAPSEPPAKKGSSNRPAMLNVLTEDLESSSSQENLARPPHGLIDLRSLGRNGGKGRAIPSSPAARMVENIRRGGGATFEHAPDGPPPLEPQQPKKTEIRPFHLHLQARREEALQKGPKEVIQRAHDLAMRGMKSGWSSSDWKPDRVVVSLPGPKPKEKPPDPPPKRVRSATQRLVEQGFQAAVEELKSAGVDPLKLPSNYNNPYSSKRSEAHLRQLKKQSVQMEGVEFVPGISSGGACPPSSSVHQKPRPERQTAYTSHDYYSLPLFRVSGFDIPKVAPQAEPPGPEKMRQEITMKGVMQLADNIAKIAEALEGMGMKEAIDDDPDGLSHGSCGGTPRQQTGSCPLPESSSVRFNPQRVPQKRRMERMLPSTHKGTRPARRGGSRLPDRRKGQDATEEAADRPTSAPPEIQAPEVFIEVATGSPMASVAASDSASAVNFTAPSGISTVKVEERAPAAQPTQDAEPLPPVAPTSEGVAPPVRDSPVDEIWGKPHKPHRGAPTAYTTSRLLNSRKGMARIARGNNARKEAMSVKQPQPSVQREYRQGVTLWDS